MIEPPLKKRRLSKPAQGATKSLFAPFRALGHISNEIPFALQVQSSVGLQRPQFNIVSCLGNSWAMWGGQDMKIRFVGPPTIHSISSLAVDGNDVLATAGPHVLRYKRGRLTDTYATKDEKAGLGTMLVLGRQIVALEKQGRRMHVWDKDDQSKFLAVINLRAHVLIPRAALQQTVTFAPDFCATTVIHPATYLNKVLVGSKEGGLQLWNISTPSLIHSFAPTALSSATSAITVLTQSPAVDVIAIGFADGRVSAYNIRLGEQLFNLSTAARLSNGDRGPCETAVTAISFRTDNLAHTLATASADGSLAIWDLDTVQSADEMDSDEAEPSEPGRLLHFVQAAHEGRIGGLTWLHGQPLLISSGRDNSIKQWAFDTPTAEPRLWKSRSGHTAPPNLIRYYGEEGKAILSAGGGSSDRGTVDDRSLRYTSIVRDSRSFELSQGPAPRKMKQHSVKNSSSSKVSPILALHYSTSRSKDWDDVVTCHDGDAVGRTWSVENKRRGHWDFVDADTDKERGVARVRVPSALKAVPPTSQAIQCCHVSACGNFGFVGFSSGVVGMWNMQSGMRRRTFDTRSRTRHQEGVVGIACDALNRRVVVANQDGHLRVRPNLFSRGCMSFNSLQWFDFHTGKQQGSNHLASGVSFSVLQRDINLLAISCTDLTVRIIDIETKRLVRHLKAFRGRIVDLAFSPDSRWLIVASAEGVVRTFDLPTGRLIDAFRTLSPITSLTFSPTGDFLATAHVDSVGVCLWANRAQFTEVSFRTFQNEDNIPKMELPSLQGDENVHVTLEAYTAPSTWTSNLELALPTAIGNEELTTLSTQPRSKWQTLLHLDTIRARNKPKEPPKAPEAAPFFLPTLPGAEKTRFDLSSTKWAGKSAADEPTSRLALSTASIRSEAIALLHREDPDGDYHTFFQHLLDLSPSSMDLELRTLSLQDLAPMFEALMARLNRHRDFEAVQAILAVLLRVQGDLLVGLVPTEDADEDLVDHRIAALASLEQLHAVQQIEAERMGDLVSYALGALGFVRGLPMA